MALFAPDAPEPSVSPETRTIHYFGDYRLLEEIARGGMGIVFRARQISLNRDVAVKLMRDSALAGPEEVRRFRVEAAAAAKLKHPNIVAIHEVGEQQGQHYFAMDLIEGENLAERTRESPLSPKKAAELVATIADAVQHAHEQGVLHRDIKPSNVLVDASGRPFVTDFGLARPLDADSSLTMTGQVLGTPGYMPPEQATGTGAVGPAADIYSLGALLYHLVTGRAPFVGGSVDETLRHVVEQEPISPQLVNPEVPRDLASVCLKCLSKRPAERYASASALGEDLRRFVRGEPTLARPAGQTERLWRWCCRKPAFAALTATTLLLVLIVAIGSPIAAIRMNHARKVAQANEAMTAGTLYAADMKLAQQALLERDLGGARRLLAAHQPTNGQNDLRGWEWWYYAAQCRGDDAFAVKTKTNHVWPLVMSPHLKGVIGGRTDGTLELWDVASRQPIVELGRVAKLGQNRAALRWLATDSSGRLLAACPDRAPVTLWNIAEASKSELLRTFSATGFATLAPSKSLIAITDTFSPAEFFAGGDLGTCAVWNYATGEKLMRLPESGEHPIFSNDGKVLVTGSWRGSLKVWNTEDWSLRRTLAGAGQLVAMEISPNNELVAAGNADGRILLWNLASGERVAAFDGHPGQALAVRFSPDGKLLATTGADQTIALWDVVSRRELNRLRGHESGATSLAFSPDGKWLVSAYSPDNTMRFWNVHLSERTNAPLRIFSLGAFSPDSRLVAAGNIRGEVSIWDVATRQIKTTLPAEPNPVGFSADGKLLITASVATPLPLRPNAIRGIKYWDVASGTLAKVTTFTSSNEIAAAVSLSPDRKTLAVGGSSGTGNVQLWDTDTGKLRDTVPTPARRIWTLVFSDNGKILAIGAEVEGPGALILWNLETKQLIPMPKARGSAMVGISADGEIAAAVWLNTVQLWRTSTRELLSTIRGNGNVFWLAFSKDGRTLVSAGKDIQLWNLATSREVGRLMPGARPAAVLFSPDGKNLFGGRVGEAYIWTAASEDELTR